MISDELCLYPYVCLVVRIPVSGLVLKVVEHYHNVLLHTAGSPSLPKAPDEQAYIMVHVRFEFASGSSTRRFVVTVYIGTTLICAGTSVLGRFSV